MEKITLKKLINHRNKTTIIIIMAGIFSAFYAGSGAIGYHYGRVLPFLRLEEMIPLLPWTILIYMVLYPLYLIWALYSFRIEENMNKTLYSFMLLTVISCAIFLIYPVNFPRTDFPLPLDNTITTRIFQLVRVLDKPSNCLPSLHVGICYCFAYGFYRENQSKFWISMALSTLVAISTLTTKQHYIYDIAAGFLLSTGLFVFFDRFIQVSNE